MEINKQLDGRVARLGLAGELTIYCVGALHAAVLASLVECDEIELDLSAVTELDSTGFQQLYLWRREAKAANKRFSISTHSAATREVFDLYRADAFFEVPAERTQAPRSGASAAAAEEAD